MLFHVAVTNEREQQVIEEHCSDLSFIRRNQRNRDKILHPSSVQLVKLPFLNLRPLTKKVIADLKGDPLDANTRRTIEILESLGIEIVNSIRDLNRRQEILDKSETTE